MLVIRDIRIGIYTVEPLASLGHVLRFRARVFRARVPTRVRVTVS